jgi:hypothetical protein
MEPVNEESKHQPQSESDPAGAKQPLLEQNTISRHKSEAIELIRSGGPTGLQKGLELLHLTTDHTGEYHTQLEATMFATLQIAPEGPFGELLDALTDAYIAYEPPRESATESLQTWCDSLNRSFRCKVFFKPYMEPHKTNSVLDPPENQSTAVRLLDEMVRRTVELQHINNAVDAILLHVFDYNISRTDPYSLHSSLPFLPQSLRSSEFTELLKASDRTQCRALAAFCTAGSMREFVLLYLEAGGSIDDELPPEKVAAVLNVIQNQLSARALRNQLRALSAANPANPNLESLNVNIAVAQRTQHLQHGTFVAVEGTLIRNDELNNRLVQELEKVLKQGALVIVFTYGNPEETTEQLRELGLSSAFLPVQSKQDYHGKLLETLIDDTQPEYQGFGTIHYIKPTSIGYVNLKTQTRIVVLDQ